MTAFSIRMIIILLIVRCEFDHLVRYIRKIRRHSFCDQGVVVFMGAVCAEEKRDILSSVGIEGFCYKRLDTFFYLLMVVVKTDLRNIVCSKINYDQVGFGVRSVADGLVPEVIGIGVDLRNGERRIAISKSSTGKSGEAVSGIKQSR